MASLFDRQASLGLNVSKSVTIYVTADTINFFTKSYHEFNKVRLTAANAFAELVEGVALMGVQNINIVFGNDSLRLQSEFIYNIAPFLKDIERYRPYINIIACDDCFVDVNKDIFGEGSGFVFHYPVTAVNERLMVETDHDNVGNLQFKDTESDLDVQDLLEGFVLLDFSHMITGRFSDPFYSLHDFHINHEHHELPFVSPIYSEVGEGEDVDEAFKSDGLFANDPDKQWLATSTLVLLAVNILIKDRFAHDKYISSIKYLDHSVKNVINSLAIRPRWKKND
jgi:hypothetical protein